MYKYFKVFSLIFRFQSCLTIIKTWKTSYPALFASNFEERGLEAGLQEDSLLEVWPPTGIESVQGRPSLNLVKVAFIKDLH